MHQPSSHQANQTCYKFIPNLFTSQQALLFSIRNRETEVAADRTGLPLLAIFHGAC